MIKGVIFDLDGVLTITDEFHYLSWKMIADKENIYFDREINNRLRGVSRMDSLDIILERASRSYTTYEKQTLAKEKNDKYIEYLDNLTDDNVMPFVKETLVTLKNKGLKLAVGSSSKNTIKILTKTNLIEYFDAIVDGNKIKKSKPDPEVFLKAAEEISLTPGDCLVIEDAKPGIKAGHDGGFKTCGIGDAKDYDLTTYKIETLKDILKYLEEPVITLSHIKKVYPNGVTAIKDFNLEINEGEFVVFVGPSGCGKSTILRMIAGLEEITSGTLEIDGVNMTESEPMKRNIAMVFQNYALYPHLTVMKNIGFPLYMEDIPFSKWFNFKYRKERKEKIDKMVQDVASRIGLSEYLNRKPKNLSGGQRQRVALGRAIIRKPKAFLLDEPLSNLDAKMRSEMRTEISKLHDDLKTTFIYVTHDQVEAMTMGSKIVVLKDGIIQQVSSPKELFMNPVNKFVASFIGTPQMNFLKVKLMSDYIELISGVKIALSSELFNRINPSYIDKYVILGIRPKAVKIIDDSDILGTITISEELGDEALIYFKIDGYSEEFVSSLVTYKKYNRMDTIHLSFDLSHASIFDIETERSILK